MTSTIADSLEDALVPLLRGPLPVRLTAWDGSSAGPDDAPKVRLNNPRALRRLLWHPGELGAAQAYVSGDLDVEGSVTAALQHAWGMVGDRGLGKHRPAPWAVASALRTLLRSGAAGRRPTPPDSQIAVHGRLHSPGRDRAVIHHHYDLSNEFYQLILDDHMAYSCAYVTGAPLDGGETATYRLEDAQADKLDLVCRSVGLGERPGMRLLDVGCGWGALSLHAAEHFGAHVTGVTIAKEQKAFIDNRIRERGLAHLVSIRLQDYRDVDDGPYDAVASLEMGEHAGDRGYPDYVSTLRRNAAPDARILVQQMSRHGRHPGGGPFIEAFIAPDMTMRPLGRTLDLMEAGGLEVQAVRSLREHYAWTVRAWQGRFDARRDELTALVGPEVVRVWELYLAGGLLAFEQGRMGVDQIVAVPRPA
ncbi:SAM-dependent methyltransferase [Leekyejoonella antrihumi]|uniref:Class I SAM-dependent methyltransferase n=1 Tax=Leekyejoonella antrihumi TaxID=1660198 RepID=A0A563E2C8_9MICO|nr:cyclopropane-fatty-acyl-phospholipid synthase family protein [Leekyejoonella antrihumi]TWP36393.1 class I SAM-dependent methyltransferase [Leekyejoonella antrihumi]